MVNFCMSNVIFLKRSNVVTLGIGRNNLIIDKEVDQKLMNNKSNRNAGIN